MRRKGGDGLTRNEERVLVVAMRLHRKGNESFHGYPLAKALADADPEGRVMNYATLYRCLDRLEERGYATSEWTLGEGNRPRREYSLTEAGQSEADAVVTRARDAGDLDLVDPGHGSLGWA